MKTAVGAVISASVLAVILGAALLAPQTVFAQESSGIFGGLFNGWGSSSQTARRGRYNTPMPGSPYGTPSASPNGPSYDLSNWFGGGNSGQYGYSRYRTLCVRTCDGYYFPISFATTGAGIARDAQQCQARCGGASLFYHRNPGADVQHMINLKGQPYSSMENAFRYRAELVQGCRCKPEPWSEAAQEEYKRRAEVAEGGGEAENVAEADPQGEVAQPQTEVAGWASRNEAESTSIPTTRRKRYRASDPALQGHWWADQF